VQRVRSAVHDTLSQLGIEGHSTPDWFFPSAAKYGAHPRRGGLFVHSLLWFERPTRLEGVGGSKPGSSCFACRCSRRWASNAPSSCAASEARCQAALFKDGCWWLDYTRLRVLASKA